ncbi:SpaH/EbpB family LPXTG-anchored major pilin [Microbacterium sp.]|uniref:SpaH/EbpB family LPXTG-anchored major pilin n=1 Tax=Microbacterium sp. TaxID=51671 RepID=UPI0039E6AE28
MTNNSHVKGRRALALAGVIALAGAGVLGSAVAANAAPDFGNIDDDATGSIIIHKHEYQTGTSVTANPDGTTSIPSAPVAGVTFTAYQLLQNGTAVDLTDPAAWTTLSALSVNTACTAVTGGTGYTIGAQVGQGTTDASGLTTITPTNLSAYVVCETAAPASVTSAAAPFIVTVPTPYQDGWVYNVNVYPKNSVTSISKSISAQTGLGLGSAVAFPVTVRIPSTGGADFTSFDIVDTLDSRLTPTGVSSVTVGGTAVDPTYYTVTTSGQTVTVAFNIALPAVQTFLKANALSSVVATFTGTVQSVGDGSIPNTATAYINAPGHATGTGITSNQVTTTWGDATLLKTDSATTATVLAGAVFEVYAAVTPYPASATDCSTAVATGSALSVGGQTTFTSNDSGVVTIPGLFVSDSVNAAQNSTFRCYVVVETQAPAGFVTPDSSNNAHGIAVTAGANAADSYNATVVNVQADVPDLPLTGANGQIAMVIGGVGLLAVAGGLLIARRRAGAKR